MNKRNGHLLSMIGDKNDTAPLWKYIQTDWDQITELPAICFHLVHDLSLYMRESVHVIWKLDKNMYFFHNWKRIKMKSIKKTPIIMCVGRKREQWPIKNWYMVLRYVCSLPNVPRYYAHLVPAFIWSSINSGSWHCFAYFFNWYIHLILICQTYAHRRSVDCIVRKTRTYLCLLQLSFKTAKAHYADMTFFHAFLRKSSFHFEFASMVVSS